MNAGSNQNVRPTRREFLAAAAAAPLVNIVQPRPVRLGGPIFLRTDDPAELAREHRRLGYSAAYCPNARAEDGDHVRAIRAAFGAENVVIAEVGAWRNMLDPDPQKRRDNLSYVTERLALAEAVGARCCVDIAGSYNPTVWYGADPKNLSKEFLDATVQNCRSVIDAVKPRATKFSIEMMGWSLPDGPDAYLDLIRAVDRPASRCTWTSATASTRPRASTATPTSRASVLQSWESGSSPATPRIWHGCPNTTCTSGRWSRAAARSTTRRICASCRSCRSTRR